MTFKIYFVTLKKVKSKLEILHCHWCLNSHANLEQSDIPLSITLQPVGVSILLHYVKMQYLQV